MHISTESALLDGGRLINATEDHLLPQRPAGSYSYTKGEAERIALFFSTQGLAVVVVRPRFIWGRDDTKGLPQIATAAKAGKLAWIEGGHYLSSTTHIANVCGGVALALDKRKSGEVYFIADGVPVQFRSFITSLLETQGIVAPTKSVPRWIMRGAATVGDFLERLRAGRIKPLITRQVLATIGFEVTLDTTKARSTWLPSRDHKRRGDVRAELGTRGFHEKPVRCQLIISDDNSQDLAALVPTLDMTLSVSCLCLDCDWHGKAKAGAPGKVGGCVQTAAMRFSDGTADG